jgi:hypothetical protein
MSLYVHNACYSDVTETYDANCNQLRKLVSRGFHSDDYRFGRIRAKKDVKVLSDLMLAGENVEANV